MDNLILILLSSLIIFSYVFDLFARRTKIPSVILLIGLGIGLQYLAAYFHFETFNFLKILPTLGTIGLILIVLEGALDLQYDKGKRRLIANAFFTALVILVLTSLGITYVFRFFTGNTFQLCFVNAIPFTVISSAIAIPSVATILRKKREFIVYESSFSDIFGIMLFNFAVTSDGFSGSSFLRLGTDTFLILVISAAFCIGLLFILGKISHHVKFFLIISILILIYAVAHEAELPALIIILAFGLFLGNAGKITNTYFRKHLLYPAFARDIKLLHQLSAESAFLLRTLFFVIFGFTMQVSDIADSNVLFYGGIILGLTYIVRGLFLKFVSRTGLIPELFITPRGLINILLFYSIPAEMKIPGVESSVLFLVIIVTTSLMAVGLVRAKSDVPPPEAAPAGDTVAENHPPE
ncbi:MAG TPA: cation:proton antiporter [Bacteroidia bacterium]|nr:cation:proton antiporter [Bacteroidia bacterium]